MTVISQQAQSRPQTATEDASSAVALEWRMGYTMVEGSVRLVRIHVRRNLVLWQWPGDVQDATLIASELAANAVRHGWVHGHELWLRLAVLDGGELLIDVSDPVRHFPAGGERSDPGEDAESGRGLHVVRALGGEISWFLREHCGKTVRVGLPAPTRE
ncbi:ATP-binding protein [Streptomyces sp. NPDC051561]|uniref:ATP-binding protein n=1 Tax=Streptomyces sp. NPDC051561 TaxID=3365658 RepID=UPI00379F5208